MRVSMRPAVAAALSALGLAALSALGLTACGGREPPGGGAPDAQDMPDGAPAVTLPLWKLEDIQPQSPRVGQTYGLDTFTGKTVVVSLLEGF